MASVEQRVGSGSFGSSGEHYATRNLVFLDGTTLQSHALWPTNALILRTVTLPDQNRRDGDEPAPDAPHPKPTQWLLHEVVRQDTNHDGAVDSSDLSAVALTDAAGNGYSELLTGLSDVGTVDMLDDTKLLLVYVKDGARMACTIDLPSRTVVASRQLATVPSTR